MASTWNYADYYREHKKEISQRRKERYRKDAEFRTRVKEQAKVRYRRERFGKALVDRCELVDEKGQRYLSIGKLSNLCNRNTQTIRNYHRDGVIPQPTHHDSRGWRLYTPAQARLIRSVLRKLDTGQLKSLKEVTVEIEKDWRG